MKKQEFSDKDKLVIKFVAYLAFFAIIVIFIASSGAKPNTTSSNEQTETKTTVEDNKLIPYVDKQDVLKSGSYTYKFVVTGESTTIYSGTCKDNKREGYKETSEGIIKYREEKDATYSISINGEEVYSTLYDDYDKELFDFDKLFGYLNVTKSLIERKDGKTTYTYDNVNDYKIIVNANEKNIEKIEISNETVKYIFTFEY